MWRDLNRKEPEVVAVLSANYGAYVQWIRETGFERLDNIRWIFIDKEYKALGIEFTMIFMVGEYWLLKDFAKIMYRIKSRMDRPERVFSMNEGNPVWDSRPPIP